MGDPDWLPVVLLYLQNLELDLPARRLRLDHITDAVVHQRAADGGLVRNLPVARVDFLGADQMENFRVEIFFLHCDARPDRDHAFRSLCFFYDGGIA